MPPRLPILIMFKCINVTGVLVGENIKERFLSSPCRARVGNQGFTNVWQVFHH